MRNAFLSSLSLHSGLEIRNLSPLFARREQKGSSSKLIFLEWKGDTC